MKRHWYAAAVFAAVGPLVLAVASPDAPGGPPAAATRPSPVTVRHVARLNPPESVYVLTADLSDPRVSVQVAAAGPDPDGPGPWQTTLLPTSEIADRQRWDYAVNGDFFQAISTKDVEGKNTGFVRGKWARPSGPAVTDGACWCHNVTTRPALEITADRHARIAAVGANADLPADVRQAVAGSHVIVRDGAVVPDLQPKLGTVRHPRTAAGVSRDGTRLILVVVDGRQPTLSVGMTFAELSAELVADGAYTALNLDGGGSTTLVCRDDRTGKLVVANSPSDTKERSVADALGITVSPAGR